MRILQVLFLAVLIGSPLLAQQAKEDVHARTIDVSVEGSSSTEADVAIITLACRNYGATEEQAYEENARRGNRLLDAFVKAGVPKSDIETGSASVSAVGTQRDWTSEQKKERQHQAEQSLTIRVATKNAAATVDLAMHSGASSLKEVKWDLSNPSEADAKANEAALAKARVIAEQLARGSGVKVGEIVSISNTGVYPIQLDQSIMLAQLQTITKSSTEPITLLPEKIMRSATVHVVFAME